MLSRRLIRVKVFKVLFGKISAGSDSLQQMEKELLASCDKTVDLYSFLLGLPVALKNVANAKIDAGLNKYRPTEQEANPNKKFVENEFIKILEEDTAFGNMCAKKGLLWGEHDSFIKKLYSSIVASDYYKEYMENSSRSLEEDINLVKTIYEQELEDNQLLEDILEDSSILWMDDLAYVINTITKNLDTIAKKKFVTVPSTFLKEEDRQFALRLLTQSFIKSQEYSQLVYDSVSNWDSDRLVATDIALIVQGITEAVYFETIPLKVTINEYVEISKYYSTPNSKVFVNGLLDKIIGQMNKDGKIVKSGRGLVG